MVNWHHCAPAKANSIRNLKMANPSFNPHLPAILKDDCESNNGYFGFQTEVPEKLLSKATASYISTKELIRSKHQVKSLIKS